jgi:hypothetical protein
VLLDKNDMLAGVVFSEQEADQAEQVETLRRLIYWFWHELSHFNTALARGQLWWAHGQLEALRHNCMNLARLRQNFLDPDVGSESYFKIERALPVEQLSPLEGTFCALNKAAMLQAAHVIVRCYQEWAAPLARAHGIPYPHGLERVMLDRLEQLPKKPSLT